MRIRIAAIIVALSLLTACSSGESGSVTASQPAISPAGPTAAELLAAELVGLTLDEFYFESYKALVSRSPETILWHALSSIFPPDRVTLDNLSENYRQDTYEMYGLVLATLLAYDRNALAPEEQLTYDIYQWHLQDVVDQQQFQYHDFVATYSLFGTQQNTQQLMTDLHPLATRQDAEDYITRLIAIGPKFVQLVLHLNKQHSLGIVEPALTMRAARYDVDNITTAPVDANPYYVNFRDKLQSISGLSDADRQRLLDDARNATVNYVIPAYTQLSGALANLLNVASSSIGVGQFPDGDDYYAYKLRHHTTTDLTPAQIHQIGLDELLRIQAEMRLIFDQLQYPPNETLQQLFARVRVDGGVIPAPDVLPTYENIIDAAAMSLDQAFDLFPPNSVVVTPDPFGGYYIGPSFDGTRPGAFYAGTTVSQPWFEMPSLTYHESLPGHHLQISIAMAQDVPAFRKILHFTAFVEGWALYAERLAFELGWYDNDTYGNLGRLQFEALRAARLVMDTGMHSLDWSFDDAVRFSQENIGYSRSASENAAGRYSVIPGQATAYMIGMLQILNARQRAMDALGSEFDLKEFHRVVVGNGAMPMALLNTTVDRYIADKLATL